MKEPILLVCIACLRKTKDWNASTMCNVDFHDMIYTFSCLVCGNEIKFIASHLPTQPSKKQKKLMLEKQILMKKLGETNKLNN